MDSDSDIEVIPSQPSQRPSRAAPLPTQQPRLSTSTIRQPIRSSVPRKRPRPASPIRPHPRSTSSDLDQSERSPVPVPKNKRNSLPRASSSDEDLPPLNVLNQPRSQLESAQRDERIRNSGTPRSQEPRKDPATVVCLSSDSDSERPTAKEREPTHRLATQSQLPQRNASVPAANFAKKPEDDTLQRLKSLPQPPTCIPAGALDKGKGRMIEEALTPDSSCGAGESDGLDKHDNLSQTLRARSPTRTVTRPPSLLPGSPLPSLPPSSDCELPSPFQAKLPALNSTARQESPIRLRDDEPLCDDSNDLDPALPSPFEGRVPSRSLSPNKSSVTIGDEQSFGEDINNVDHALPSPFEGSVTSPTFLPSKKSPVRVEDDDSPDEDYTPGAFGADLDPMEAAAGPTDLSPRLSMPVPKKKRAKGLSQAEKQAERQAKAEESRLAREAKKAAKEKENRDKKLRREVNKQTLDRKQTVSEVRMWVPKSLMKSKLHPLVKACQVLEEKIQSTEGCVMKLPGEFDDTLVEPKGLVRWFRTLNKKWDEALDEFVPLAEGKSTETRESTVLVVWSGKEVDEMIASGPNKLLERVQQIKTLHQQDQLFIIISGLESLLKAEKKNQDALIAEEARAQLAAQRQNADYVPKLPNTNLPKNSGEKLLSELEMIKIVTKCFVIRVEGKNDLANWLWEMTLEIGVRPYKARKQNLTSALRLEGGGSKGTNCEDTYIKMLSSLTRVTENEAKGIVYKFPTLNKLYSAWDEGTKTKGVAWAEEMLVGCSKGNTLTGATATKKLGKVTSKRIYDILYRTRDGDTCGYN